MNKRVMFVAVCLLPLLAATAWAQAWRGEGRLHGVIVDPSGKPVAGAKIILKAVRGSDTGPEPILADEKGRWVAGGLIGGAWNIDVEAEGFLVRKLSANVSELQRLTKPMKIQLEPKPEEKPKPEEEQKQVIQVGGVEISPEIAQAIESANNLMKEEKWKEAAVEYEKALTVLSDNMQLRAALARAYYGSGEMKKAIANLQQVYASDTGNVIYATLLADMLLEDGQLDEGRKVLAALPPGALSDPNTIINLGIRFVNHNKPDEAYKYFNDAVALAPDFAAAYYYRGITSLQMKKMKEARADLQKVIAIAPESSEAKDARDLLAQMK